MSKVFFVFLCLSLISIGMARSVIHGAANDMESSRRTQESFKIAMPVFKSLLITSTGDMIGSEETKQQFSSKFFSS